MGGTIGPTPTFGYPKEPTNTEGGLEPLIESDENRFPYFERWALQFSSIDLRMSFAVGFTISDYSSVYLGSFVEQTQSKNELKFKCLKTYLMTLKIVSFLPSVTELLYELGASDHLVGVTHECLYPFDARSKPRVINSVFDPEKMSSFQIDQKITELSKAGKNIFVVDEENLRKADPDLIIAQGTCAVCSAYTNEVNMALAILDNKPQVEVLDPHTIDDVLDNVVIVAKRINKEKEGHKLVESLRKRIDFIKNKNVKMRPKILCIEWVEPFFTSGHWVPQMVEIAGGTNLISATSQHSRKMTIDEVEKADPDIIILMPCGFDMKRTIKECSLTLQSNPNWKNLRAVKNNKTFAVDANSYFSKPSIRTITGIEILAKIIHPDEFSALSVPADSFKQI
jgi:iron complex transport system substrate-binding protein